MNISKSGSICEGEQTTIPVLEVNPDSLMKEPNSSEEPYPKPWEGALGGHLPIEVITTRKVGKDLITQVEHNRQRDKERREAEIEEKKRQRQLAKINKSKKRELEEAARRIEEGRRLHVYT